MHAACPTAPSLPAGLQALRAAIGRRRHFRRIRALRRDPRRFGSGRPRFHADPVQASAPLPSVASDLRLFLHTFAAGFLFMTVFLA